MRLIKKTTYKRVQQLPQHKKILQLFDKFKEDSNIDRHNSIKRTKDASKLKYFFVVEFDNLIKKKLNINNFIEKDENKNDIVNIDRLLEEKNKLEEFISNKRKKEPLYFEKLGNINQVTGVYLIGTNKKSVIHIKDLDLRNKNNLILIKLDVKKLPKEIEEICNEYYLKTQEKLQKEKEEFEKFSNLNQKEQDVYINNILDNINYPPLLNFQNINIDNIYNSNSGYTFYDGFSEKNINSITNIEFLESLLTNAIEKEQYEFCAKIRDRIIAIKS